MALPRSQGVKLKWIHQSVPTALELKKLEHLLSIKPLAILLSFKHWSVKLWLFSPQNVLKIATFGLIDYILFQPLTL